MNNLEHFNANVFSNTDSAQTPATHLIGHFIQGGLVTKSNRKQAVYNPATGEISKEVALADTQLVNQVVQIAEQAFPAWRDTPVIKRARVMFKFKQLLEENAETLDFRHKSKNVQFI